MSIYLFLISGWLPPTPVHVRKGRRCGSKEEFEGRRRGMVQPSQQHVAPCVKGAEWVLGTRGLGLMAAVLVGIPVDALPSGHRFIRLRFRHAGIRWAYSTPCSWGGRIRSFQHVFMTEISHIFTSNIKIMSSEVLNVRKVRHSKLMFRRESGRCSTCIYYYYIFRCCHVLCKM